MESVSQAIGLLLTGGVVTFIVTAPLIWMPRIKELTEQRDHWRREANYNDERDHDDATFRIIDGAFDDER